MDDGEMKRKASALFEQLRAWHVKSLTTPEEDAELKSYLQSVQSDGLITTWRPQEMMPNETHYILRFRTSWMPPTLLLVLGAEIRFLRSDFAQWFQWRYEKANYASGVKIFRVTPLEATDGYIDVLYEGGALPKSTVGFVASSTTNNCRRFAPYSRAVESPCVHCGRLEAAHYVSAR